MTLTLSLYAALMKAFHAVAPNLLWHRAARNKEDPARLNERLGIAGKPRPDGPLVWVHGVSVGESLSALPVINQLLNDDPGLHVLITSATTTSAEILSKRLPERAVHQYIPVDTPQAVDRFLDHWSPDLAIFIESDLWPNLLTALDRRGITRLLISARITGKTARGWQRTRRSMTELLRGFSLILPQDAASDQRLRDLLGPTDPRLGPISNLKTVGAPLPDDAEKREILESQLQGRPLILAASTHPTEENYIATALDSLIRQTGALLIIAPRHPVRAEAIRLDLEALGLRVAQRSQLDTVEEDTHIYLADTLGELGVFFRLADVVIMAGSFSEKIGGHNPLEAARLGKAVITGPDLYNWDSVYTPLFEAGAAFRVMSRDELGFCVQSLLDAPAARLDAHRLAQALAQRGADTLPEVMARLKPFLPLTRPSGDNTDGAVNAA